MQDPVPQAPGINFELAPSLLNKCINIPCKRFRSPDFIWSKSVPDIVAGFHRW
jgi:hypothetical protein